MNRTDETAETAETASAYLEKRALALLLMVVSLALGWVLLPFYGPILWGVIIALLFEPLYRWLLPPAAPPPHAGGVADAAGRAGDRDPAAGLRDRLAGA